MHVFLVKNGPWWALLERVGGAWRDASFGHVSFEQALARINTLLQDWRAMPSVTLSTRERDEVVAIPSPDEPTIIAGSLRDLWSCSVQILAPIAVVGMPADFWSSVVRSANTGQLVTSAATINAGSLPAAVSGVLTATAFRQQAEHGSSVPMEIWIRPSWACVLLCPDSFAPRKGRSPEAQAQFEAAVAKMRARRAKTRNSDRTREAAMRAADARGEAWSVHAPEASGTNNR